MDGITIQAWQWSRKQIDSFEKLFTKQFFGIVKIEQILFTDQGIIRIVYLENVTDDGIVHPSPIQKMIDITYH